MAAETLEREDELDRIAAALDGAARGAGQAVLIEGPAGIGKTRLVQDARALAKARGFGRLQATGDELESAMGWSVVRQLVERSISRYRGEVREALLAGPSGRALDALGAAPPADAGTGDPELARTLHALWWVAVDLSASRPLLITVDDAQWADAPSIRFLGYLARRIDDLPVALVVASRPPQERAGPLAELSVGHDGERIRPRPLTRAAVAALGTRDGVAPAPEVAGALHAASGGNPFLARLLLDELDARALPLGVAGTAREIGGLGPRRVSQALLARLPAEAAQLASAAAVLGARSDPWVAAELAGLEADAVGPAVDALIAGHVLAAGEDALAFVHPVVREAVLAQLGPGERSALHGRAARTLQAAGAPVARVAAHLAQAPPGTLPDSAALLRAAATGLLADGDAATAAGHLARALAEAPEDPDVRAELGLALLRAGEPAGARDHLLASAPAAPTARERAARLAGAASATAAIDGAAMAITELRSVLDAWPAAGDGTSASDPARLVLESRLATISFVLPEERSRAAERLRALAALPGDSPEERTVLALLAQRGRYDVRPADEVATLAARSLAGGAMLADALGGDDGLVSWLVSTITLTSAGGFEEAAREVALARTRVRERGAPVEFAIVSVAAGWLAWRTGDVAAAESESEAALAAVRAEAPSPVVTSLRSTATHCQALSALERGDLDAAEALLTTDEELSAEQPRVIPATSLREARALLMLARDAPDRALAEALLMGQEIAAARGDTPTTPWRIHAAHAALRLGDETGARELAEAHLALARRWDAPVDLGIALRACARTDPERRLQLLTDAVALLEPSRARLECAKALVHLGEALRVDNQRRAAHEPLLRGAELATACGAPVLKQRALDGLAAMGDRPRELSSTGEGSLTASELRVARFALDGRTNRDIAQELFVTPKTVENHLGRVYVKLGITGRRQLAAALG